MLAYSSLLNNLLFYLFIRESIRTLYMALHEE